MLTIQLQTVNRISAQKKRKKELKPLYSAVIIYGFMQKKSI